MIDILVVGAGIVGSFVALDLSRRGLAVAVAEQSANGLDGISGRNSGVLHAGIYYPTNSNKARHCVEGRRLTIEFAEKHKVPYEICGKLILASQTKDSKASGQLLAIEALYEKARQNGVQELEILSNASQRYPYLCPGPALWSKGTGLIDAPVLLRAVQLEAEREGAIFLWKRKLCSIESGGTALLQNTASGEEESIEAGRIINAAGLYADEVAELAGLSGFAVRPNRGEYYRLARKIPDSILIYPVPEERQGALGVHYTYHLSGDAYAGPNSLWARDKSDYEIQMSQEEFYRSLCQILNFYKLEDLRPGYSGLRPRLFYQGEPVRDFVIQKDSSDNIHLLGIESPGLTSAPSLAKQVAEMIL